MQNLQLLDIIKLTDLVHSRKYFAKKLSKITNLLKITKAVFTITRDNVASNNTMLNEFEAATSFYEDRDGDCPEQPWRFTRKEGDVRCIGHIINLAVQAALAVLKAVPSTKIESYQVEQNLARLPILDLQDQPIMTALNKIRRHIYVFWNRRTWRDFLKS